VSEAAPRTRPPGPVRVLAAHGTQDPFGQATVAALADAVARQAGPLRLAWLDVLTPELRTVLAGIAAEGRTAVVVPALLSAGYHGRADIPAVVADVAPDTRVAPVLGDDPRLVRALADRLTEAGWAGEPVVLAATGSARPEWHTVRDRIVAGLTRELGVPVVAGVAAGPGVPVVEAIAGLRTQGYARVAVSAYLIAEGHFWNRITAAGAEVTTRPLGTHPALIDLLAERFKSSAG
jgi:sirohydrochlorin ferrochelatase